MKTGPRNSLTDVDGLSVGNATCEKTQSGVTAIRCAEAFVCAVDIRGGAPATRETDVLDTNNLVGRADAIILAGGSVFGLAAGDGAANTLSQANIGLRLAEKSPAIPIVPAAALHDLGNDGDKGWGDAPPYRDLGSAACAAAALDFSLGRVGAGRGAMAGSVAGGLGSASVKLGDATVAAIAAVNPVGSVFWPDGKHFYAGPWEIEDEFGGLGGMSGRDDGGAFPPYSRLTNASPDSRDSTILAVVATDADLTGAEAKRIAMMAQDGIARAIRPAHTIFDGDIVFAISTGTSQTAIDTKRPRPLCVAEIGAAAADCLTRAIARGVYHA